MASRRAEACGLVADPACRSKARHSEGRSGLPTMRPCPLSHERIHLPFAGKGILYIGEREQRQNSHPLAFQAVFLQAVVYRNWKTQNIWHDGWHQSQWTDIAALCSNLAGIHIQYYDGCSGHRIEVASQNEKMAATYSLDSLAVFLDFLAQGRIAYSPEVTVVARRGLPSRRLSAGMVALV